MVKDTTIFTIKDSENGDLVGTSTSLPRASAVYDLAEKCQRPLGVFVRELKLFDTRTIEQMLKAV